MVFRILMFLRVICLCHSVQVASRETQEEPGHGWDNESYVTDDQDFTTDLKVENVSQNCFQPWHDKVEYNASSPDEKALIEASSELGLQFVGESEVILQ